MLIVAGCPTGTSNDAPSSTSAANPSSEGRVGRERDKPRPLKVHKWTFLWAGKTAVRIVLWFSRFKHCWNLHAFSIAERACCTVLALLRVSQYDTHISFSTRWHLPSGCVWILYSLVSRGLMVQGMQNRGKHIWTRRSQQQVCKVPQVGSCKSNCPRKRKGSCAAHDLAHRVHAGQSVIWLPGGYDALSYLIGLQF